MRWSVFCLRCRKYWTLCMRICPRRTLFGQTTFRGSWCAGRCRPCSKSAFCRPRLLAAQQMLQQSNSPLWYVPLPRGMNGSPLAACEKLRRVFGVSQFQVYAVKILRAAVALVVDRRKAQIQPFAHENRHGIYLIVIACAVQRRLFFVQCMKSSLSQVTAMRIPLCHVRVIRRNFPSAGSRSGKLSVSPHGLCSGQGFSLSQCMPSGEKLYDIWANLPSGRSAFSGSSSSAMSLYRSANKSAPYRPASRPRRGSLSVGGYFPYCRDNRLCPDSAFPNADRRGCTHTPAQLCGRRAVCTYAKALLHRRFAALLPVLYYYGIEQLVQPVLRIVNYRWIAVIITPVPTQLPR